ncbi:hypothetical protein BRAO375_3660039 [Bradyrhizobium sp. ORS 375]|uniref:hypothetical protein n=1 Tax=Bradyrhizobium sp. (strain ORS 375) TaxID=566679 RepID=UPI0002406987|nr:hypothetical protein [Bradyrhizobium sp. ORS 375]CCD94645.1 hypothetical protein BRAO375_3660039 [Bradyrhizobium sp. ORS 375]
MKLENFHAVAELMKERDYLISLKTKAGLGHTIRLGGTDVRPDICAKMRPEMLLILEQQIAVVDQKLFALGVTTKKDAA